MHKNEEPKKAAGDGPPWKVIGFTCMLMIGLVMSQVLPGMLDAHSYHIAKEVIEISTMFALSFIMVQVGYEFHLKKDNLGQYVTDYLVAMTAAGFPWLLAAWWLKLYVPNNMSWSSALLMGRFASPTSAGILFSMLAAAGLKETWLFKKARILAIFDDLDTILFMIPLKIALVGFKWELTIDAILVGGMLALAWVKMHDVHIPSSWKWTAVYAAAVTFFCWFIGFASGGVVQMEVLLPAFTFGCITAVAHHEDEPSPTEKPSFLLSMAHMAPAAPHKTKEALEAEAEEKQEEFVKDVVSYIFMLLVGLSIPPLFSEGSELTAWELAYHVAVMTFLMTIGKMFVIFCYADEADFKTRFALALGMCPRGEVGAGVIVITLNFGLGGAPVTVAVMSLAVNLVMSSFFIMAVKHLASQDPGPGSPVHWKGDKPGAKPVMTSPRSKRRLWGFGVVGCVIFVGCAALIPRTPEVKGPAFVSRMSPQHGRFRHVTISGRPSLHEF